MRIAVVYLRSKKHIRDEKVIRKKTDECVECTVLVPKRLLEFLKAVHTFGKYSVSLEEFIGSQIVFAVQGDFGNELVSLLPDPQELAKSYGLQF
jgi:hypothetical protein